MFWPSMNISSARSNAIYWRSHRAESVESSVVPFAGEGIEEDDILAGILKIDATIAVVLDSVSLDNTVVAEF